MRAEGFARQPIVRMTNVNLEPGDAGTLDDLIAATERGLLIETNRSWSIDDRRLQFQFEGEAAWEIQDGERGRLLRNPSYAGVDARPSGRGSTRSARRASGGSARCSTAARASRGRSMHVSHGARAGALPRRGGGRCRELRSSSPSARSRGAQGATRSPA